MQNTPHKKLNSGKNIVLNLRKINGKKCETILQSLIIITHHIYKTNNAEMEIINMETSLLAKSENDLV
jgi:hypothetical protein